MTGRLSVGQWHFWKDNARMYELSRLGHVGNAVIGDLVFHDKGGDFKIRGNVGDFLNRDFVGGNSRLNYMGGN